MKLLCIMACDSQCISTYIPRLNICRNACLSKLERSRYGYAARPRSYVENAWAVISGSLSYNLFYKFFCLRTRYEHTRSNIKPIRIEISIPQDILQRLAILQT